MPFKKTVACGHIYIYTCVRMLLYVCDHTNITKMYSTNVEERALDINNSVHTVVLLVVVCTRQKKMRKKNKLCMRPSATNNA